MPLFSESRPCGQVISVTRPHMPNMEHIGHITKFHGAKLPQVYIISFGSPCQDLSAAGKRAGITGSRSNLFYEAIRITNKMKKATDGRCPRLALWENIPGAFHSNINGNVKMWIYGRYMLCVFGGGNVGLGEELLCVLLKQRIGNLLVFASYILSIVLQCTTQINNRKQRANLPTNAAAQLVLAYREYPSVPQS